MQFEPLIRFRNSDLYDRFLQKEPLPIQFLVFAPPDDAEHELQLSSAHDRSRKQELTIASRAGSPSVHVGSAERKKVIVPWQADDNGKRQSQRSLGSAQNGSRIARGSSIAI